MRTDGKSPIWPKNREKRAMNELIPLVAIVFGTGLAGFIFYGIYKIIHSWVGGPSGDAVSRDDFNRLGKAFVEFRKDALRRIENLESKVADKDSGQSGRKESRQLGEPSKTIEIDRDSGREKEAEERKQQGGKGDDNSNLRNMLRE